MYSICAHEEFLPWVDSRGAGVAGPLRDWLSDLRRAPDRLEADGFSMDFRDVWQVYPRLPAQDEFGVLLEVHVDHENRLITILDYTDDVDRPDIRQGLVDRIIDLTGRRDLLDRRGPD